MISSNIKLSGSTVIPCKWPVSQLFGNFDYERVNVIRSSPKYYCCGTLDNKTKYSIIFAIIS